METRIQGNAFLGQIVLPPIPTTNVPNKLNHEALLALPLIGLWVGVDELVPSKNVFAIYDPGICGVRYTHGDGTLIPPEQVLFSTKYKDPRAINNRSTRVHVMALNTASTNHYDMINRDPQTRENLRIRYPTTDSVKKALMYHVDAPSNHDHCQALQDLDENNDPSFDHVAPAIDISSDPRWDFDPTSFQAYAPQNQAKTFDTLYKNFQQSYQSPLDIMEFQHATFCLAGLVKANMVPFVCVGQHNPRIFTAGQVSTLLPKAQLPLRTTTGWTADCFIARWDLFKKIFEPKKFVSYPSPVQWLEAELDVEEMLSSRNIGFQFTKPWKGKVYNVNVRSVLDWDILKALRWQTRGDSHQYPKPYQPNGYRHPHPSSLNSQPASWPSQRPRLIPRVNAAAEKPRRRSERRYHDPNESEFDRRVREQKEKLQKRTDRTKRYEYPDYQPTSDGLSHQGQEFAQSDNHRRVRESRKPRKLHEIPEYQGPIGNSGFDLSSQQMEEDQPLAETTQLYYDIEGMGNARPSNNKRPYGSSYYGRQQETYQQPEYQADDSYDAFEEAFPTEHSRKKSRIGRHYHTEPPNRNSQMPTIDNLFASPGKHVQKRRTSEILTLKKEQAQYESDYAYDGDFAGPCASDFDKVMGPLGNNYGNSSKSGFYPSYAGPSRFAKKPAGHVRAFEEALNTFERKHRVDPSDLRFVSTLQSPSSASPENQYLQPSYGLAPGAAPSNEHGHELSLTSNMQLIPVAENDEDFGSASALEQAPSVGEPVLPLLPSIEHREEIGQNDLDTADVQLLPPLIKQEDVSDRGATQLAEDAITIHSPTPQHPEVPAAILHSPIALENGFSSHNAGESRSISFNQEGPQRRLRVFERYSDTASFDNGSTTAGAGPSFSSNIPDLSFTTTSGTDEVYSDQTIPNDSFSTPGGRTAPVNIPIEMITSASGVADLFSNQPVGTTSRRRSARKTRRNSNYRANPIVIDDSPPPSRHRRSVRSGHVSKLTMQSHESLFANSFDLFGDSSTFRPSMTCRIPAIEPAEPPEVAQSSAEAEEEHRDATPAPEVASEQPDVKAVDSDVEGTEALLEITPEVD